MVDKKKVVEVLKGEDWKSWRDGYVKIIVKKDLDTMSIDEIYECFDEYCKEIVKISPRYF